MPSAAPLPSVSNPPGNIASLSSIDFSKLLDRDSDELAKVLSACERDGFFYLNLLGQGSEKLFDNLDALIRIMKDWFAQPLQLKLQTATVSNAHGFKPTGVQSGVVESSKDGFEVLKIARQELLGRWALPPVVDKNLKLFDDFTSMSHYILKTLLSQISDGLGLKGPDRLELWHRDDLPSKSTLYFLHYPEAVPTTDTKEVGQNMHTDIGSLTLLFAPQWGLQVFDSTTNEWQYVEPKTGHAIINVADTLQFLSNRRFRSALHRVVPIEGQLGDRSSVSYFLRANDSTEFRASDGKQSNAKDWYFRKYDTYKVPHEMQRKEPVLTGGMGNGVEV